MDYQLIGSLVLGLIALVIGAEIFIRGAVGIAKAAKLTPLVIGLTVVAFGTSFPELVVSATGVLQGQTDIAFGNVVGSNIFNTLFILGISALICPLIVHSQLLRRDLPLMIGVSLLAWFFARDGGFSLVEGLCLVVLLVLSTWKAVRDARKEVALAEEAASEVPTIKSWPVWASLLATCGGIAVLILGSRLLVFGAVGLAKQFGLSELVIGLTIVAVGTSLPEVATSVLAAIRGQRDIAVGNVVGSNVFNILGVLGISATLPKDGIGAPPSALELDVPMMVLAAIICIPVFLSGRIGRRVGALFLAAYILYTVTLILHAEAHPVAQRLRQAIFITLPSFTLFAFVLFLTRRRNGNKTESSHA